MRLDQPDEQGTLLLSHLLNRVAFKLDASYSFIVATCVMDLGLEVKTFREARYGSSSLGCRVRVDRIDRDCESEISEILLTVISHRVGNDSRFGYPLEIALGVGESARARYMDVIHDMD